MSKIKIRNFITFIVMLILAVVLLGTSVNAASFSITASKTTLNIGDTASVTIKADDCLGQFSISSSDSSIVSVSDTSKWLENNSSTITITAKKAGKATITLTAKNVSDTAGDNDITGSKSVSITVSEPVEEKPKTDTQTETPTNNGGSTTTTITKSSDATLKSITVGGKKYNNPNTTITANSVSADISSIKIEAQTNNSKAKVTGTGTKDLVTGTNKFTLKVTAEDGSTKSYTIKITKLAEETTTPNIVEETQPEEKNEEKPELRLSSLIVEGIELIPKFEAEVFEYSVFITNVNEVKITAIPNIDDTVVEIMGNTELIEGENTAVIKLSKDDKTVEYRIIINKAGLSKIQENTEIKIDKSKENKTRIYWNN